MSADGLIPKEVTVTSKCAKHGDWRSDESMIAISFVVPVGMERRDLNRAIYVEKEKVDLMSLTAEFAKGRIDSLEFQSRKQSIVSFYDRLLKRAVVKTGAEGSRQGTTDKVEGVE